MSWRPSHDWTPGAHLPAMAAGVAIIAARLSTCSHCHTLRVIDEGTGVVEYIRRMPREEDRVSRAVPACLTPSPFFRPPSDEPAAPPPVPVLVAPAVVEAPAPPPQAPQLALW